jgi:2-polyprenyl-3-methyl-5-hydroxy-6-metoxy-1,4-benzoquinol methylase
MSCDHCFTDLGSIAQPEQYQPDYFEKEHRNWFLHPNLNLYAELARTIAAHKSDGSVLDVGCGNGNFLRYLASESRDLSLTGIDMAPNPAMPGITYLQGDFLDHRFDRTFDVQVSLAVIEHIADVTTFAKRTSELCAPNGLVMTMTVDDRSLIYSAARGLKQVGYSVPWKRLYSKHHLNHFTSSSLRRLLEQQGLTTIQVIRHNSPIAAVDIPTVSPVVDAVLRSSVWAGFKLGTWTQRTMLQTVISQKAA